MSDAAVSRNMQYIGVCSQGGVSLLWLAQLPILESLDSLPPLAVIVALDSF
jgi:hypothetical protein